MLLQIWRASGNARAFFLFFLCSLLALNAQVQDNAIAGFKFTKIDNQALDDANEFDRQTEKRGMVLHAPELDEYLTSIGKRVIGPRPAPEQVEFRFRVLRDPMVNAFALPNGTIYVTTGLLSLLENEAQLAAVLGHESSHVFDRHSYLENRSARKKALTINIVQGVAAAFPGGAGLSVGVEAFCVGVQLGSLLTTDILIATVYGYSREMERQADGDGLTAMVSARYDPNAMARSFELMDEDGKLEFEPIQGFYHDHPKLTDRRATALAFASTHTPTEPLKVSEKDYLEKVAPAICANVESDIRSRRARTAVARATRLTNAMPDEPKYQVLLADAYRSLGAKTKVPAEDELSRHGQAEQRKEHFQMTEQEEQRRLMQKPEGEAALRENLDRAEKLYTGAIQRDSSYAEAHRGLGFLYEQQAKNAEAAGEYRRYLELVAGTSIDRVRIERRLAAIEKLAAPQPTQEH
jgi:Zn-dependent protease with chaperone function